MNKIELLAPAGDLEKLKIAIEYGADAVYFGGENFSLRAGAGNMSFEEMKEGIDFAHKRGKKCNLTLNVFPHNYDIDKLYGYLYRIKNLDLDAFIISDPGTVMMVKEVIPGGEIHLSTQANLTNYKTAEFWGRQGVKRVVMARELSLAEMKSMRDHLPENIETEAFIHGAMCISYSGRCLLSNFMTGRDANKGECAHPCRWKYSLVEEERPEEAFPVYEDRRGTYIMNSKDLCMIEHIPQLVEAGISSAKIEGRMKSVFYAATVVKTYRQALDAYYDNPEKYNTDPNWLNELRKVSHRDFTTGFYFKRADEASQNYETNSYIKDYVFLGLIQEYSEEGGVARIQQRNKMVLGDEIEVFGPKGSYFTQIIEDMRDEDNNPIESAPHPKQTVYIKLKERAEKNFMLRRKK